MSENIIVIANGECPVLDKDGRIIAPGRPQDGGKLPPVTSSDNGKVLGVVNGAWDVAEDAGAILPDVTASDNGKVLGVVGGAWDKTSLPAAPVSSVNGRTGAVTVAEIPSVSAQDENKILTVENGAWTPTDRDFVVEFTKSGDTWTANASTSSIQNAIDKGMNVYGQVLGSAVTNDTAIKQFTLILPLSGKSNTQGFTFGGAYRSSSNNVFVTILRGLTVTAFTLTTKIGTYSKPSGGIPASDLASAVQDALVPDSGSVGSTLQRTGTGATDFAWKPGVVVLMYSWERDPDSQEIVYSCNYTEAEIADMAEQRNILIAMWSDNDNSYISIAKSVYNIVTAKCENLFGDGTSYLMHGLIDGSITVEFKPIINVRGLNVEFEIGLDPQTFEPDFSQVTCDVGWDQMHQAIANGTPIAAKLGFIHPVSQEFIVLGTMVGGAVDPTNPVSGDVMLGVVIGGTLFDFAVDSGNNVTVTVKVI